MSVEVHVSEFLPAYALDCLDPDERMQVARHVAVCSACQAELRSYESVTGQLALVAPEALPSPELKERLQDGTIRHLHCGCRTDL